MMPNAANNAGIFEEVTAIDEYDMYSELEDISIN